MVKIPAAVVLLAVSAGIQGDPGEQRQQELRYLLAHDCGSCHGMTLKGGLGPSLRPEALEGKPDDALIATVLYGRPGTPMPPWRGMLTEDEVRWLVSVLRGGDAP